MRDSNSDITAIRHEFEFAADAFAFGLQRSKALNEIRFSLHPDRKREEGEREGLAALEALREYQVNLGAASLLFLYMDFIDRAGQLLKGRLGEKIRFRSQMDSHPSR
jgi:hypothetical protein